MIGSVVSFTSQVIVQPITDSKFGSEGGREDVFTIGAPLEVGDIGDFEL